MSIAPYKNQQFDSFNEFETFINNYGESVHEAFVKKSSKKLNIDDKEIVSRMKYHYAYYSCKFGGTKYRPESTGQRVNTSTYKVDCPAKINVKCDLKKNVLVITEVQLSHENHDNSKPFYKLLPEVRRLTPTERNDVKNLLELRCDKKRLQQRVIEKYNKYPIMKDFHNICAKKSDGDDLVESLKVLVQKNAAPRLLIEEDTFKALYFSTARMRQCMNAWPEIIFIDGTYKLLKMGLTVMILMVEDSNTSSEIVAVCLVKHEDYNTFKWFLQTFKEENEPACDRINGIMADKDLLERDCLKEVFGEKTPVFVCLWHALKTFNRKITKSEMGITEEERRNSLSLIEKMSYSKGEENYNEFYAKLQETAPKQVAEYYNKNWHNIRHEWALSTMAFGNFKNRTNNRLESLNAKIKQVVQRNSTLVTFLKAFFIFMESHKLQNFHKTSRTYTKTTTHKYSKYPIYGEYMKLLTLEAFEYILPELEGYNDVHLQSQKGKFYAESSSIRYYVTTESCQCATWRSLLLPCRHIFALRKILHEPLFYEKLCNHRWTKEYCQLQQQSIQNSPQKISKTKELGEYVVVDTIKPSDPFENSVQKLKFITSLVMELISSCCNSSGRYFQNRLNILGQLKTFWLDKVKAILKKESDLDDSIRKLRDLRIISTPKRKKPLTEFQKRKLSENIINDLKTIILHCEMKSDFDEKVILIKQIINYWKRSIEFVIVSFENSSNISQSSTSMVTNIELDSSENVWKAVPLSLNQETFESQEEHTQKTCTGNIWEAVQLSSSQEAVESQKQQTSTENLWEAVRLSCSEGTVENPKEQIQKTSTDNLWKAVSIDPSRETVESKEKHLKKKSIENLWEAVLLTDNQKNKKKIQDKSSSLETLNIHRFTIPLSNLNEIEMPISEITRGRPAKHLDTWIRTSKRRSISAPPSVQEQNSGDMNLRSIKMPTMHITKGRPRGKHTRAIGLTKKGKK